MAGKGKRRREKNYLVAHGATERLPPPPNPRELDTLPSKLRKIIQLKKSPLRSKPSRIVEKEGASAIGKEGASKEIQSPKDLSLGKGDSNMTMSKKKVEDEGAITNTGSDSKKGQRKRKRKVLGDLRFQNLVEDDVGSSRKKRRKEHLDAKKKKHKLKKAKTENILEFPGREEIKFGEVVQAPPKLSLPKKGLKAPMDASRERVRLQTIDAYRNRRGWVSRPGIQLPTIAET